MRGQLLVLCAAACATAFVQGFVHSSPGTHTHTHTHKHTLPKGRGMPRGRGRARDMVAIFDQLTQKMTDITAALLGKKVITEDNIEETLKEMKVVLLDADVNLRVANTVINNVKGNAVGMQVIDKVTPGQQFVKLLYDELVQVMGSEKQPLAHRTDGKPTVIMMAGLQGAGKTTSTAKLASYLMSGEEPRSVMMVAADVYRPAAIEQLQTLGQRLGVPVYAEDPSNSPVDIAKRAVQEAAAKGIDTVLIDTAGRQAVDEVLMAELRNIKKAVAADELLLVVDAMTGQEAATLTAKFNDDVGITGAILTKLDGDTRGGSALSVRGVSGKPIKFIGTGETMDKLEPFYPERMASRIMGMGDVVSFVEKAQKELSNEDAEAMSERMIKGQFTFDDFLKQARMIKNMGSMAGVLKMLPGMAGKVSQEQLWSAEKKLKISESLIEQMTAEERINPDVFIRASDSTTRLRRIADASGQGLEAAQSLIMEFQQMRTMMQRMGKQMAKGDSAGTDAAMGNRAQRRAAAKEQKGKRGGGKGFGAR